MRKIITIMFLVSCFTLSGISSYGSVVSIDFGPSFGAPAVVTDLTDQLQSYGVTFSSEGPNPVQWHGLNPNYTAGSYCINGGWYPAGHPNAGKAVTEAIRVDFNPYVLDVSLRGFDGGGDVDLMVLTAYDNLDNVVDSAQISSSFSHPGTGLAVSGSDIAYIKAEVFNTSSGLFFDDLTYTQIPEPASIGLIGLVSGGIFFVRRFFAV